MYNILKNKEKMNKCRLFNKSEAGFTLIEMAIVIIIGGILLSFLGSALIAYMKKSRINTTEFRSEIIQEALAQYLSVNKRYPCAASRIDGPADPNFGREVNDCSSAPVGGARSSGGVRIGAIPTRTLNLPDDFITDGWGNKFTYAVTEVLATPLLYSSDGGLISVLDSVGNPLIIAKPLPDPPSLGHYVLVSHGASGNNSYPLGSIALPRPVCAVVSLEDENCNDDAVFRSTLVSSDVTGANFYDDYTYYKGQTAPVLTIPAGAVMAFNLGVCPDGWAAYAEAEGRFVMGADNGILPAPDNSHQKFFVQDAAAQFPIAPYPVGGAAGETTTLNLASGVSGITDSDPALIPPYIALLYCEKLP